MYAVAFLFDAPRNVIYQKKDVTSKISDTEDWNLEALHKMSKKKLEVTEETLSLLSSIATR